MNNPRILLVTRNLPPLVGGMERLNWHMADELSKQAEVRVIGPKGSAALKPPNVQLSEAPLKPLPLFLLVAFCKALWCAIRYRPDVILAGSGLTAPIVWLASKLCRARCVAYLHGFDITVQDRVYQSLWVPVFKKLDHVIVNSTPTQELAFAAGVPEHKTSIVYPGVSLPDAPQPQDSITAFKQRYGLEGKKILLSVGRLTTRKGLKEFVKKALPEIVKQVPEAILVVVGEAPKNSLGAGIQSQESIEQAAADLDLSENIRFLGGVSEDELLCAYEAANLHIFPIRYIEGDPEGFGMVAIEAAAHGLPTVAFANGGVVDAVRNQQSGHLVANEEYGALVTASVNLLQDDRQQWLKICQQFASEFVWERFADGIRQSIYNQAE